MDSGYVPWYLVSEACSLAKYMIVNAYICDGLKTD